MDLPYDRTATERALTRLRHEPLALDDADFGQLAIVDEVLVVKGYAARKAALLARVPSTPATTAPLTLTADMIADVIVETVTQSIAPITLTAEQHDKRVAALEAAVDAAHADRDAARAECDDLRRRLATLQAAVLELQAAPTVTVGR